MIYELIQPSDAMTIEAENDKVAQIAGLLLGEGKIGVNGEAGQQVLPLLFLGSPEAWMQQHFPDDSGPKFIEENVEAIAKCLESILYCNINNRKAILAAVGEGSAVEAFARYNDQKRSSLNDYSSYAHDLALRLRASAASKG